MIGKRFSAAVETYDRHAKPQLSLAHSVLSFLPEIYPDQILELGSGTGQVTKLLAERFPDVLIDAVDLAEKMIEHSREKFRNVEQINWIQADAQTYRGAFAYPLIVSSSALHWVSDLRQTCLNIYENLEPGGYFALGMMLEGTLKELHEMRREVAPQKPPKLLLPSFDDTVEALQAAGLHLERKKHSEEIVAYEDSRSFLKVIHEQGVTSGRVSMGDAPLTRSEIVQLMDDYQDAYRLDAGVYASYETATFLVSKA